ncbi:MAG: hypothetical protein HY717_02245 [Planctomycetes bacterium]|nr:hypothetical protein [Planctomycetota bacterium]
MEKVRDHLAACPQCRELALDARAFLAAAGEPLAGEGSAAERYHPLYHLGNLAVERGAFEEALEHFSGALAIQERLCARARQEEVISERSSATWRKRPAPRPSPASSQNARSRPSMVELSERPLALPSKARA